MPRLINPVSEMMQPLQRVEQAIAKLATQLRPVGALPSVHEELIEVNRTLVLVLDELRGLRLEMASPDAAAATGPARARG